MQDERDEWHPHFRVLGSLVWTIVSLGSQPVAPPTLSLWTGVGWRLPKEGSSDSQDRFPAPESPSCHRSLPGRSPKDEMVPKE